MAEQIIGYVGKPTKKIEVEPTIIDVEPTKVEPIEKVEEPKEEKPKKTTKK